MGPSSSKQTTRDFSFALAAARLRAKGDLAARLLILRFSAESALQYDAKRIDAPARDRTAIPPTTVATNACPVPPDRCV
jgi:hypothetical protein